MTKKTGLGRGLNALFPSEPPVEQKTTGLIEVPVEKIVPNPQQPRKKVDQSELEELAARDSLTGLYNRRHFGDEMTREFAAAQRYGSDLACLMFDLDHFKPINDQYGHRMGDKVLVLLADSIAAELRTSDVAARFGGDEFIVLLPGTKISLGKHIAERVRNYFDKNSIKVDGKAVKITLSIGISGTEEKTSRLSEMLKCADQALYEAKGSGRNCVKIKLCPLSEPHKENSND